MKATKYLITALLCVISIVACVKRTPQAPAYEHQLRSSADFTQVVISGNVEVALAPRSRGSNVTLSGYATDLARVTTRVQDQTLILDAPTNYQRFGKVKATVAITQLNGLKVSGQASIKGRGIHASLMDMQLATDSTVSLSGRLDIRELGMSGNGHINLSGVHSRQMSLSVSGNVKATIQGVINLEKLHFAGNSTLKMDWINARALTISGQDKAQVVLAGIAETVNTTTRDESQFDGRNLRTDKTHLIASDQSTIRLQPLKALNANAKGQGQIYYYQNPVFKTLIMSQEGAVLDMTRYR